MGHIPYGYKIENGKPVIDEEKAEQVRELYKAYLSGLAYVPAAAAVGLKLCHTSVKNMLRNSNYIGNNYYPAIIDKKIFDAAEDERVKRQIKLGRVFEELPPKVNKPAAGFRLPKTSIKYDNPLKQAEYIYSLIESEVCE